MGIPAENKPHYLHLLYLDNFLEKNKATSHSLFGGNCSMRGVQAGYLTCGSDYLAAICIDLSLPATIW